jgi:hypothetical protein
MEAKIDHVQSSTKNVLNLVLVRDSLDWGIQHDVERRKI